MRGAQKRRSCLSTTIVWAKKKKLVDLSYLKRLNSGKKIASGKGINNKPQSLQKIKGRSRRPAIAGNSRKTAITQNAQAPLLTESNPQALRVGS